MKILNDQVITKAKEENFSGVISIYSNNNEVFNKAFGFRDIPNKIENNTGTKFGIASGTKFITALGIGKLIDTGEIGLRTKITEIFKEKFSFINKEASILNLLNHTSGIYDYYDEDIIDDFDDFYVDIPWYKLTTPSDYLPLFMDKKPKFKPGERFSYSNGGYVFLGAIIEKISSMLYRDFIKEYILMPLSMGNSGFYPLNELPENTANGYKNNRLTTNIYNLPVIGGGDGGMFSNTYDIYNLWVDFFDRKVLSPDLTDEYIKTQSLIDKTRGYGCGIYKTLDNSVYYITGCDAGVDFFSLCIPESKTIYNIFSNITEGDKGISEFIIPSLTKKTEL